MVLNKVLLEMTITKHVIVVIYTNKTASLQQGIWITMAISFLDYYHQLRL